MQSPSTLYPKKIDLTNCDKEPIHIIGAIQDHGYLIAFSLELDKVLHCSQNCQDLFKRSVEHILVSSPSELLTKEVFEKIIQIQSQKSKLQVEFNLKDQELIAIVHKNDHAIIVDIEPRSSSTNPLSYQSQISEIITEISESENEPEIAEAIVQLVRKFIGYDRVMVYKFDKDWNGKIIAESKRKDLESWKGLQYPATDIPKQVRKLFIKQSVRILSDVKSPVIPVLPQISPENNQPLDLSNSELRASSPIHIEYLNNMKVGATLNAAIVYQGELWGLIACHHYSPKFVNFYQRQACKFLAQVVSIQLGLKSYNSLLKKSNDSNIIRQKLIDQMSENWDIHRGLTAYKHTILDLTESTGAAILIDDKLSVIGKTPTESQIKSLVSEIAAITETDYFESHCISEKFKSVKELKDSASGVLCVFITNKKKDALLFFKPEVLKTVEWGGNPNKPVEVKEGERLSPRKSFEKWSQLKECHSEPWKDYEIAAARALKDHIGEIILEKYQEIQQLNQKLQKAYIELESFSYSVSHDLRAPLRGIDGFAQIIREDYFESLDDYGKNAVETIIESTNKMNTFIDDILAFSGLGNKVVTYTQVSINEMVKDVLNFINPSRIYPGTEFKVQEDLPDAFGDKSMLTQLISNLVNNAFKYSSKTKNPKVEIGYENKAYYVKDNGIGFDEKHKHQVFGVFSRLVSDEYQGSGIGLAIAKRVIEKHNGNIWVESKLNQGTTFFFTLNQRIS